MTKISVIIPCYNSEKCLSKCMDSLDAQTLNHDLYEAVFVNDCSKDNTLDVLRAFKEKADFNVLIVDNKKNSGPGLSRQSGVKQASGEFVCFCDSDDWYDESFLEQIYEKITAEHSDIVMTDMNYVFQNKTVYKDMTSRMNTADNQSFIAFAGESLCNLAVKKDVFLSVDAVDVRNGEDLALVPLIMMKSENKSTIKKPLYNYFIREDSASVLYSKDAYKNMLKAYDHILNHLSLSEKEELNQCIEFLGIKIILYNATLMALKTKNRPEDLKDEYLDSFNALYPKWYDNPYISSLGLFKKMYLKCMQHQMWILVKIFVKVHSMVLG